MSTQLYPQGIRPRRFFDPREATDFQRIEHAASLKGLLKPFKGKEALTTFAGECEAVRDALIQRAQRLLAQATAYPFSMPSAVLTRQTTAASLTFGLSALRSQHSRKEHLKTWTFRQSSSWISVVMTDFETHNK